jgi:hypothetical protein
VKANSVKPLSRAKKLVFWLLLSVFFMLTAESCLQVFYRITAGQWLWQWYAAPLFEPDALRVYRVKSNLDYLHKTSEYSARYYSNAQGFRTDRGQEHTRIEKPAHIYRVMYLGPSFTFGWGVDYEQSYVYVISKKLSVPDKKIETINVGTPAQPINYQLAWFEKEGYWYAPDLIIQTVYSDCCTAIAVDGTLSEEVPYIKDGYLYPPPPKTLKEEVGQILRRLRRYSALMFYGWRVYVSLDAGRETIGMGQELYEKPSGHMVCAQSMILEKYRAYQQFVWRALGRQVPIVFVYVPMAYIVRPADFIRVKHQSEYKDPPAERANTREVEKMLNDNGIRFVDLTDALVKADGKTRMYNLYDIHFTSRGNQVAADIAMPIIQQAIDDTLIE